MKKLLCLTSVFYSIFAHYQDLISKTDAIKTTFEIVSNEINLDPENQILIKRGVKFSHYDYSTSSQYGYGYGGGYESYHLEFTTRKDADILYVKRPVSWFILEFYDLNHNLLMKEEFDVSNASRCISKQEANPLIFYSFDLIDVPLLILNETKEINLIEIEDKKK